MQVAERFNILAVVQAGRLTYEAIAFMATFRDAHPNFAGRVILAEPQPGPRWFQDPTIHDPEARALLERLGADIIPFENTAFGEHYPNGNKICALSVLPKGEPFLFFDTDTVFHGRVDRLGIDFDKPSASLRREGTWPMPELYGPGYDVIWRSLYDRFGLEFEASLDTSQPEEYWQRYLYFNAGWFYGPDPKAFGDLFLSYATEIEAAPGSALDTQEIYPWLDQIALPLVIHCLGGGRDSAAHGALDGTATTHYRYLPLLYAMHSDLAIETLERAVAPNRVKKVLKKYEAARRLVFQGKGAKLREMFDQQNLPRKEQAIRQKIKKAKMWWR